MRPAKHRAAGILSTRRQLALWATLLAAGSVCRTGAAAAPPCTGTDACLQLIETSQRSTRVLSARFRQTKHVSLLAEPLVTSGQFGFRQPDEVVWRIDEPPITVRIDRDGIHLPDAAAAQDEVAALAPFSAMMRQLSSLFAGSLTNVRDTFAVTVTPEAGAIRVHLVPRQAQLQHMFSSIDISFLGPEWVVTTVHLEEALGDSLDVSFSDIHRNDDTASAAFDRAPRRHD